MRKLTIFASILALSGIALTSPAFADGAALAKDKCGSCHGADGNSTDSKVPSIAGFPISATMDSLEQYKEGDRKGDKYKPSNGDESDMNTVAKALSEADVEQIANYYAGQKFKTASQSIDAALAAKGAKIHEANCEKCHSEGGASPDDDAPLLAGQWKDYLSAEFGKLAAGDRDMPKKMKKKFDKLALITGLGLIF